MNGHKRHRIDVRSRHSERHGIAGVLERLLRRTRSVFHGIALIPLYALSCIAVGASSVPAYYFYEWSSAHSSEWAMPWRAFAFGTTVFSCYFLTGFTAMLIVPLANFLLVRRLKAWRGSYYSLETIPWYIHNGATYLLRFTFLEFITPSPFNVWFYRAMGMKIGRDTVINTSNISDPSLIEIGSRVTLGGSVTLVGHYGQAGFLVLSPVKIGDNATIGLRATIMGGVTIGAGAKILPNSVVLPGTVVPDGEIWGGVPAQKYSLFKNAA